MAVEFLASGLLGLLIGMRFRVLALVPVTLASLLVTAIATGLCGYSNLAVLASVATSFIGLQLGYVCGSFAAGLKEQPALEPGRAGASRRYGLHAK